MFISRFLPISSPIYLWLNNVLHTTHCTGSFIPEQASRLMKKIDEDLLRHFIFSSSSFLYSERKSDVQS